MTPPAPTPGPDALRRARTFWEQSQADLKDARRKLRARAWLDSSYLSFQAGINALTCVCYLHGEVRVPNFSTLQLVVKLQGFDPAFEALEPAARDLEQAQELNPYAAERDAAEEQRQARLYYDHGASILKSVRVFLKSHRARFFAP